MRILNIHGPSDVRLDDRKPPVAGERDVIVQIKACGICGTDLSYIKTGGINRAEGGVMPLGHEAAGEVVAIGNAVQGLSIGERVLINPMMTADIMGNGGSEGAFSEAVLVRDAHVGQNLLVMPDDLSFELAALAEPLAVALHSFNRANLQAGEKVVVFGCGPIGLGIVLWLADRGYKDVAAVDVAPDRLARARALGAAVTINPATDDVAAALSEFHGVAQVMGRDVPASDVYLDAAGAPSVVSQIIGLAKWHARLVVVAAYANPIEIDFQATLINEMNITTAIGYPTELPEVLAALPRLRDKASSLISHRYAFAETLEALRTAATPQSAKVMVTFD